MDVLSVLDLKISGLYTHPNPFGSLPQGALIKATNVDILREDIAESRRGSKVVFTFPDDTKRTFVYQGTSLVHHGTSLAYDSGSFNFLDYANSVEGPNYPIYSSSASNNFYLTSSQGILKLDQVSSQPRPAGVPQGLGPIPSLIAGTIVPNGDTIAYRVIWGYRDANGNLLLGAPSPRAVIENTSGGAQSVSLKIWIPDQITTTEYFYQVYRSATVTSTEPLDELYLVEEITLTATDLANGFSTYDDTKTTTGATIYTAPSQQGIQGSNFEPPIAKDLTFYNQMMVYANVKTRESASFILTSDLGDGFGYKNDTGDTFIGNFDILNLTNVDDLHVGMLVECANFPAGTRISSISAPTTVICDQPATVTSVGIAVKFLDFISIGSEVYFADSADDYPNNKFLVNTLIQSTALSICNIINSVSTQYSAYYQGIGNVDKGKILIQNNDISGASFTLDSSFQEAFTSNFPITSVSDVLPNSFVVSKIDQPEAIPLGTLYQVGTKEFPILRALSLRDGIYIFKGDGIYRAIGNDPRQLTVRKIDNTGVLVAPQTAVVLDNVIFCFTEQGISTVDQGGAQVISRQIERDLLRVSDPDSNFADIAFGVAYETDRKYIMFCNTTQDDEVCTQAYVYNTATQAWTRWELEANCAIVNYADDKLYIGQGNKFRQERKNYDVSDYAEDEVDVTILSISGLDVTLLNSAGISVGWSLVQNGASSKIEAINGNVLTLKNEIETLVIGSATCYEPFLVELQWYPIHGGDPTVYKHFQEFISVFDDARFEDLRVNFFTDLQCENQATEIVPFIEGGFGECGFGEDGFGDLRQSAQPIRTFVPLEQSRSPWLNINLQLEEAYAKISLAGQAVVFEPMDTRFR